MDPSIISVIGFNAGPDTGEYRFQLAEVRGAVLGYRATGLVHEFACARSALTAAQVEMLAEVKHFPLPAAVENVLALALREAVTNIVRHAAASRCEIALSAEAGQVCLRISDNGQAHDSTLRKGSGLSGMTERVSALGGKLRLKADQGLTLELRIPTGANA